MAMKLCAGHFYGLTTGALRVSGFTFSEIAYEARFNIPKHSHELPIFCFVLTGSYTERFGRVQAERSPSTLIFHPSASEHTEDYPIKGRHFLIEVESQHFECIQEYDLSLNEPTVVSDTTSPWLATKLYKVFRDRDSCYELELEGLTLELLANALRSRNRAMSVERKPPKWFVQVRELLHDTFLRPPTLVSLARSVGVHPTYLASGFRKFQGSTIGEYVRQLRVDCACRRISTSNDPFVEIALAAGFGDQSHFSRSFRRVTGMTPSEYRHISGKH